MSFSGGGGGTAGVVAHLHTNAAGQGGSLDSTSLLNDEKLLGLVVAFS